MGYRTICQGVGKSGGELGVDGNGVATFSWVGVDVFGTAYLIYGLIEYRFFIILNSNLGMFCSFCSCS